MARPDPRSTRVEIDPKAARAVLRGHPWIWREAIRKAPAGLPDGTAVLVCTRDQPFLGWALWDHESPIALRMYGGTQDRPLDAEGIAQSAEHALALRDRMFDLQSTDAFRLCNGEGDRVPGLVIDRYGPVAVVRFDGSAILRWSEAIVEALTPRLRSRGIDCVAVRDPGRGGGMRGVVGRKVPSTVDVREHGMRMQVDLEHGQKTGAFLDQRENRRRVRGLSHGARVLNLFSYAGGFSCAAAIGGALEVTSVDIAHGAHGTAHKTFSLNGLDPAQHLFVTSDVFSFLERAASRRERWDLVISDPPSFAHNERTLTKALGAYRKLHAACSKVLGPSGALCASSCSSHVDHEAFLQTLDDETLGAGRFVVSEVWGQPEDHPSPPCFPEGRYLKFVVLRDRG
ncbi:MAG: class I SAM-dependent rRNA methyltransferase [Deltaproteobacteria bacterium]|nr:class I SAM-dependent rRNA methyltransferase [Deltaproteobacteria bacterium]